MAGSVAMAAGPLQSYLDKWLAACPWQRQALVFVDAGRYPGHLALAALYHEWLQSLYAIRELPVAAAKLQWWLEEMDAASRGDGRHPLSQLLFDQPQARRLPAAAWTDPLLAALAVLEQGTATDFTAQLAALQPLHQALARLENGWWFGPDAACDQAANLGLVADLLVQLGHLGEVRDRDALPLPMQLLARHHLSRAQLASESPARRQAVQTQASDLLATLSPALAGAEPVSVFRRVQADIDRRYLQQLRRQGLPPRSEPSFVAPRWRSLWQAWSAARRWQQALR